MVITIKEPGKPTKEMIYDGSELSPFDKTKKEKIDKPTEDLAPQAPPRGTSTSSDLENSSFKITETNGKVRTYMGLEKDAEKLPTGELSTGSIAVSIDTGDVRMYDQESETWFKS